MDIPQSLDLAVQHHTAGRFADAERIYAEILALDPDNADALHLSGVIALQTNRLIQARDLIQKAIARNPAIAEYHNNLGNVFIKTDQIEDAIAAFEQAIRLRPSYSKAHSNLGNALKEKGELDEAIAAHRRAIALSPGYAEAHNNLGKALKEKGRLDEAVAAYFQAIALDPGLPQAHFNLGNALKERGQVDDAIVAYRQAISLDPGSPDAHYNLSSALLARGDFREGWEEYEWRWKCRHLPPPRNFAQPQWDGRPLEGRTILLHAEQGFGDALQFIRYVPLLAQRTGNIVIECPAELKRLFQSSEVNCQIVTRGQPLPAFDLHCALLSLPRIFGTTSASIPSAVPYLRADLQDAENWRRWLDDGSSTVKVGLAWAGSPTHGNDRNRSLKLANLGPLAQVPGVRFFSLQKGEAATEARTPPPGMELVDRMQEIKDFADTAALIANLDLVIAVDTAVAHLAGALAKPIWTMLPLIPDWRWLLEREDSPWYPTMRLFRQSRRGDWDSVITRIVDALSQRVKRR